MTPAAAVALRILHALGVTSAEQAREILALWCQPTPRLAVLDVQQILGNYPTTDREDPETGEPLPPGVDGFPVGGAR